VFWTITGIVFGVSTAMTLGIICIHPVLRDEHRVTASQVGFYLLAAVAPLVHTWGYVAVAMAIAMFLVQRPIRLFPLLILLFSLMFNMALRSLALGSATAGVYFVGIFRLICNISKAVVKLLLGVFGSVFSTSVTDTLYVLDPVLWHPLTLAAALLVLASMVSFWRFVRSPDTTRSLKANCGVLLLMSGLPFLLTSFASDPSNPNPDLSHQMPRYFYLSAAIVVIPLAHALVFELKRTNIRLLLAVIVVLAGMFSTRQYSHLLRPHTDMMRWRLSVFLNTKHLPKKPPYEGTGSTGPFVSVPYWPI